MVVRLIKYLDFEPDWETVYREQLRSYPDHFAVVVDYHC